MSRRSVSADLAEAEYKRIEHEERKHSRSPVCMRRGLEIKQASAKMKKQENEKEEETEKEKGLLLLRRRCTYRGFAL